MTVPLFASAAALAEVEAEVAERIREVLGSGRYILGEQVAAFEAEFAAYLGVAQCVGVNSGTDALAIGLRALGVGQGDEVIVPAVTFFATAEAVLLAGARPVFADVEPESWCISAATVEPTLTERTRAIVPVHLFGNPAPVGELVELAKPQGVRVLEDAAQAAGAALGGRRAGALADAAAFSFYPSKNLPAVGDAGALTTDDPEIAEVARRLRQHGSADRSLHTEVGFNSRLDEVQAAALRVQLPRLDAWTAARRAAAATYDSEGLAGLVAPQRVTPGAEPCFHLYVVTTAERDRLHTGLKAREVESRVYYTPPLHRQPALESFRPERELPGAERFAAECLALPMGPSLSREQVAEVVRASRAVLFS
ncbi:MAG: DegT/DnrJ/EryC1/StrS family aminotransferase [Actinomycetota bacterium]|nr:DegT/DnrJ/EryC1/StrS family aminotransferase [Actinomycetota bacterium]